MVSLPKWKTDNMNQQTTIAAIATPPGQGGVGIIRISGPAVPQIAQTLLGKIPAPRYAIYSDFTSEDGILIDEGLALYFENPHSFTGEDVLELQGHGGPVIQNLLLKRIFELGAIPARPGEFSERAFLNGKMDLTQAEAIADLIAAQSEQAARSALRSLKGEFSVQIDVLLEQLIQLRTYVEAAIDFPEEEVDFLADQQILTSIDNLLSQIEIITAKAKQGTLLQEGMTVVIAGEPNVGKSSLLNQLSGEDSAIVSNIPGTTRDVLREKINIDGLPLHIVDTAGLRDSDDPIEQEGIRRAQREFQKADCILLLLDIEKQQTIQIPEAIVAFKKNIIVILNKIDLIQELPALNQNDAQTWTIKLSAKTGVGIDLLRQHLKTILGYQNDETPFNARRRHLEALLAAKQHIKIGKTALLQQKAGELLAEELRQAQNALSEITGKFLPDDLLGKIFSSFCIGK